MTKILKFLITLLIDLVAAWLVMDALSDLGIPAGFGTCYLLVCGVSLAVTGATLDMKSR
jgi:hypothetical protein